MSGNNLWVWSLPSANVSSNKGDFCMISCLMLFVSDFLTAHGQQMMINKDGSRKEGFSWSFWSFVWELIQFWGFLNTINGGEKFCKGRESFSFRLWGRAKAPNMAFFPILSPLFNLPFAKLSFIVNEHTAKKLVLKHDTLAGRACTCVPNVILNCKGNTASRVKQHLLSPRMFNSQER